MDRTQTASSLIVEARNARGRDWPKAIFCAAKLRSDFPDNPAGYRLGAVYARELGQYEEAIAILAEGASHFPDQAWVTVELAWTAWARRDLRGAFDLAAKLRDAFPGDQTGYLLGALSARSLSELEEALTILVEGASRFPKEAWVTAELARTAHARGDVLEAMDLAAELRSDFPEDPSGYRIGAILLRSQNRLAEALPILREAALRFPAQDWFRTELDEVTQLDANRAEAGKLSDILRGRTDALLKSVMRPSPCRRVVVIVGMHRAGTSLCARIIERLGIKLGGPLQPRDSFNADGYYELIPIVNCHNELLRASGTTWDTIRIVRPFSHRETPEQIKDRLKRIVSDQLETANGVWAFKDPRTTHFLPLWKEIFSEMDVEPIWLLCVRDPRAVAASLLARDGLPLELGELLWIEHYLDALRHLGPEIRGVIHYDKWFSAPLDQLGVVVKATGAIASQRDMKEIAGTIKTDLRHHKAVTPYTFEIAEQIHSWLRQDALDLQNLKRRAWRLLSGMEALVRSHSTSV